jgi:hypothetical protein
VELSLPAEVLLLSIDPGDGGLVVNSRRRLRKSLKAAGGSYRGALRELRDAGLVAGRRNPKLTDRGPAGTRFRTLWQAADADTLSEPRDIELFILLGWSGVLASRLPREDRRVAAIRLRKLGRELADTPVIGGDKAIEGGAMTVSPLIVALDRASDGDPGDPNWLVVGSGLEHGLPAPGDSGTGGADFSTGA